MAAGAAGRCAFPPLDVEGKRCASESACGPGLICSAQGICTPANAGAPPDDGTGTSSSGAPGLPDGGAVADGGDALDAGVSPDAGPTPDAGPGVGAACVNLFQDDFFRPNQIGWGATSNDAGVPPVKWGGDADGGQSVLQISSHQGMIYYPGSTGHPKAALAGASVFNGGEALVEASFSAATGPIVGPELNACLDDSCFYSARINTQGAVFELVKRTASNTTREASMPLTAAAGTRYWIRARFDPSTNLLSGKVWQAGATEPPGWQLQWLDPGSALGAAYPGAMASWSTTGTSQSVSYQCFAFVPADGGSACPCGGG